MPIYTRTGDEGTTGLFGKERVPKDSPRIAAYGTIDELNSFLGLLRCEALPADFDKRLESIQNTLFEVGSDLATPAGKNSLPIVKAGIAEMEAWIDESEGKLPRLSNFVLPGGHREAALLHILRTVTRRAERRFWTAQQDDATIPAELGVYLNRLSDLFFSWARWRNLERGVPDTVWTSQSKPD